MFYVSHVSHNFPPEVLQYSCTCSIFLINKAMLFFFFPLVLIMKLNSCNGPLCPIDCSRVSLLSQLNMLRDIDLVILVLSICM